MLFVYVKVWSDILFVCGFGSSVVVIVVVVELVDELCGLKFFEVDKLYVVSFEEGYLDNVGVFFVGGFVIGLYEDDEI